MAMVARLVPHGHVVGLDLWRTEDKSGNTPEVTRRNVVAERRGPGRAPTQTWRTFLCNHAHHIWAADLLTVPH